MALVDYLKEGGPKKVHNIDNLLLRESMDVIGEPTAKLKLALLCSNWNLSCICQR